MRAHRHLVLVPVAAVAASTVLFACHRGDSILLVEVAGDLRLQPASFQVAVEPAQAAERLFKVAPKSGSTGSAVTLPASLSIEMAPNLTGPVTVSVSAFDINGFMIAYGSTTQTDINVGGETIVVVTLTSNFPPPVDAGTDALSGTGGSGVDAGGSGGGGAGAAGSGGGAGSGMAGRAGTGGSGGVSGAGGVPGSGGKGGAGASTGSGGMGGIGGMPGTGGAGGMGGRGTGGSATGGTTGTGGNIDAGGAADSGGDA
jgi:hypothetical protein